MKLSGNRATLLKENICLLALPADERIGRRHPSRYEIRSFCGEQEAEVMVGPDLQALVTTNTNPQFMDWLSLRLRQYFPPVWLGWVNTTCLKFIKHSVIPADVRDNLIIWYMEYENTPRPSNMPETGNIQRPTPLPVLSNPQWRKWSEMSVLDELQFNPPFLSFCCKFGIHGAHSHMNPTFVPRACQYVFLCTASLSVKYAVSLL